MNNSFSSLRKFNGIEFLSEEEKDRILAINADSFKVDMGSYDNPSVRLPDYFINNIFSKSIIENYFQINLTKDDFEFHKKSFDKYFVNYSKSTIKYECILHDKKNKSYSFYNQISGDYCSTFVSKPCGGAGIIPPEFKDDEFYYWEVLFSTMVNYCPDEEIIDRVNKMFSSAIECFDGEKISDYNIFSKLFDLVANLSGSNSSYSYRFGYSNLGFILSHKEVRNFFNMLSSKMVYFDISSDYDKSESMRVLAKTCYEMVKAFSCTDNANNGANVYYTMFSKLISLRNLFKNSKPRNYTIVNDPVISVVVELAHIYAEKNNLDLIRKDILQDIFLNRFMSEFKGSFRHAVIYSHSLRDNSMLNFALSAKNLKKIHIFGRKVLYSAAIMSGNLNDNLISSLSSERCIIDDYVTQALMISRFLYKDSKITRKMSAIQWRSNNFNLLILLISFLEKSDMHILMSLNIKESSLFRYELNALEKIIKLEIENLESNC